MGESTNTPEQHHRRIFLTVAAGVFMSTLDSSLVNVALPSLMEVFHSSLAVTEWVVLVYLLAITVLLVFWGRLSSVVGPGPLYSGGMFIFGLGSLLCGIAPSVWFLIGFRFVQAVGASMMMATGPALIRAVFPPERLGRGLGMIGVATSMGLMSGPVLSGLILRWAHWRFLFWVTVPVALFFYIHGRTVLVAFHSRSSGTGGACRAKEKKPFDRTGALLWAGTVSLTIVLTTHAVTLCCGNGTVPTLVFVAGSSAVLLGWLLFFRHEAAARTPILPLELFRRRFFAMAMASSALSFAALFFVLILIPFYLDRVMGLAPDRIGFVMTALPLSVFVVSPLAGRLYDLIGARIVATTGLACCLAGLILLTGLAPDDTLAGIALRLALMGFGQALFLSPNSASALAGVSDRQAGLTAGLLATARNFGMLGGTALAGLIFALSFARATGGLDMRDFTPALTPEFMLALKRTFRFGVALSGLAVAASWLRRKTGAEKK